MRELIPLQLPQEVEDRKRKDAMMSSPISPVSQSSPTSDLPSPSTPTFSLRNHGRFPSSTSSLSSSPVVRESIDGFGSGKRPLTEVKEEPQERDDDYEMIESSEIDYDNDRDQSTKILYHDFNMVTETHRLSSSSDYDLADGSNDFEYAINPIAKRQRPSDFASNGFTSRLGTRFPSLSQKWRNKRATKTTSIVDGMQEVRPSRSRANSTRAPSLAGSEAPDLKDNPLPPTPARSIFDDRDDDMPTSKIDIQKANAYEEEGDNEMMATTPLLPPILAIRNEDIPYQSPLQSPTVADHDCPSGMQTPITSPQLPSLPSPPLSTKPSISSFHRGHGLSQLPSPTALLPSSEIPPLPLASTTPYDLWSDRLGHANFTITPEPYVPHSFDLDACKQLRQDWDHARSNYTRHLMRVGEHYGATSRIYRFTEEKWVETDAVWKSNINLCLSQTADAGYENALELESSQIAEPAPLIKIPSLNGPKSEGKFPKLGDEVIVGPMEQVPASPPQPKRSSKKRSFLKFLQGMLPNSAGGVFGRDRSPS